MGAATTQVVFKGIDGVGVFFVEQFGYRCWLDEFPMKFTFQSIECVRDPLRIACVLRASRRCSTHTMPPHCFVFGFPALIERRTTHVRTARVCDWRSSKQSGEHLIWLHMSQHGIRM